MICNYKHSRCSKLLVATSVIYFKGNMEDVKSDLFSEVSKMEIQNHTFAFLSKHFICDTYIFLSQEVWACWHELLSYLEKANKWLSEVEFKLKTTENIPGGAEEISEVLEVICELI